MVYNHTMKKKRSLLMEETKERGRPTLYKPTYCSMLLDHMETGGSFEGFGGIARVSKQTLYDWCDAHPEFLDAKQVGTSLSLLWWENKGKDNLIMQDGVKFNASVWNRNMENRFNWSKKVDTKSEISLTPHQLLVGLIEERNKALESEDD
jgi:hypothetical protein